MVSPISSQATLIHELAQLVAWVVGFQGEIVRDLSKPDGMARKLLSVARLRALGWSPRIDLPAGITAAYAWFLAHGAVR